MKKPSTPSRSSSPSGWHPKSAQQRLADIAEHSTSVKNLLSPITLAAFLNNSVLQKAACFDVLCVSESTARLLELDAAIAARHATVPWRQIADIGNVLRHEYGRIDMNIVWDTVTNGELDVLLCVVSHELETSIERS